MRSVLWKSIWKHSSSVAFYGAAWRISCATTALQSKLCLLKSNQYPVLNLHQHSSGQVLASCLAVLLHSSWEHELTAQTTTWSTPELRYPLKKLMRFFPEWGANLILIQHPFSKSANFWYKLAIGVPNTQQWIVVSELLLHFLQTHLELSCIISGSLRMSLEEKLSNTKGTKRLLCKLAREQGDGSPSDPCNQIAWSLVVPGWSFVGMPLLMRWKPEDLIIMEIQESETDFMEQMTVAFIFCRWSSW